jgi:hypothetical protein
MSDEKPQRETPGESKPLVVDYSDSKSVIAALQDENTSVDLMELRRPDRAETLEEVAKWARHQEGFEELKEGLLEACLVANVPKPEGDGLIRVDPEMARNLFEVLVEEKAEIPSLLYPFLVMMQDENRKGLFQEADVLQRLPEAMGVEPETVAESLSKSLKVLQDQGLLIRYDDGAMFLHRHYIEPSREEALAAQGMPIVEGQHNPDLDLVDLPSGLTPFRYRGKSDPQHMPSGELPPREWPAWNPPPLTDEQLREFAGAESVQRLEVPKPTPNEEYIKQRLRAMLEGRKDDPSKD